MLFAYNEAFKYGQFGYASALGDAMVRRDRRACSSSTSGAGCKETQRDRLARARSARKACQYVALARYLLFLAFPLLWMLSISFKGPRELVAAAPVASSRTTSTFANYRAALTENGHRARSAGTASRSPSLTALLTTLIGLPAAYVLARQRGLISQLGLGWILLSQMFPLILIIIPLFLLLRDLHLTNTHIGLVLVYVVWTLPFILWMLQSYVRGIPRDLEEAATVDGARRLPDPRPGHRAAAPARASSSRCSSRSSRPGTSSSSRSSCSRPRPDDAAAEARAVRRHRGHRPARPARRERAARDRSRASCSSRSSSAGSRAASSPGRSRASDGDASTRTIGAEWRSTTERRIRMRKLIVLGAVVAAVRRARRRRRRQARQAARRQAHVRDLRLAADDGRGEQGDRRRLEQEPPGDPGRDRAGRRRTPCTTSC